jgi:polar amino acid transport system substrate-binding protein
MVGHMVIRMKSGAVALLMVLLTGCSIHVPADPHGTLSRATDEVLRVGVTENRPWVELGDTGAPSGTEPGLISDFAEQLESDVEWTVGNETDLLDALDQGKLDLVLGGFLEDTLWADNGAITRPYVETTTPDGTEKHVMIVRMGENGFLVALETFLHETTAS